MAIPSADQHPTTELPLAANGAVTISLADDAAVTGSAWGDAVEAQRLPASTERYLLKGELAHGGMGVVYRATDRVLNREVALKVLRDKFGAHSAAARRFADEARITAQLQHPAIPPIHDLGVLADGRPFLAMKLIKGETLEDLLATRTDPGVDRGRFVAAFEQVCQAIAYAHAHRVIHRDLKPANVMVGSFAEVQVMDWGLAKVLPEAGSENTQEDPDATWGGSEIRTGRDSNGVETQAGSILGTPAFMPPEQAIGAIEQIDERSDVFGLGAILAVMLTGQPPFLAHTREAVRILAAQGMVDDCLERLATCGADPGLVTLCKRCLSPLKADRPRNADEVAKAVAALRSAADERARQAELERIRSEGERAKAEAEAREQRKRRRTQLALIGTVGLLLAAASGFAWWQDRQATLQRERLARNAEAVTNLILQAEESLQADDPDRAAVAVEQAAKRMADGGADGSSKRLHQLRANLILLRELDRIDNLRWTPTVEGIWFPGSKNLVALWEQAFANFGILPGTTSPPDAAARLSHTPIRERVLVAFDRWLMNTHSGSVAAILAASDPDAFRTEVRSAIQSGNVDLLKHLARKEEALNQPAWFVALTNETSLPLELRRTILERAIKNRPGDLALLMDLACIYPFNQREGAEERPRGIKRPSPRIPATPRPGMVLVSLSWINTIWARLLPRCGRPSDSIPGLRVLRTVWATL
jgi:serine/threonine protein kinase